jgi:AcrR family transcriptional regulator
MCDAHSGCSYFVPLAPHMQWQAHVQLRAGPLYFSVPRQQPATMNLIVKPRRKPSQSRAWMTSGAIQDAFVLLLVEHGYEKVSMREIASVAGVGLGTLFLYFPGKHSIAAVTVRSRLRRLAATIEEAAIDASPRTLAEIPLAFLQQRTFEPCSLKPTNGARSCFWSAASLLPRSIASSKQFVYLCRDASAAASDWPPTLNAERTAFNAFSIVDAMAKHALLVQDTCPDADQLIDDVECAVSGYLRSALERWPCPRPLHGSAG